MVALLGVWRAGKVGTRGDSWGLGFWTEITGQKTLQAYVPLEPSFPPQRRRFMLDDSQAKKFDKSRILEKSVIF